MRRENKKNRKFRPLVLRRRVSITRCVKNKSIGNSKFFVHRTLLYLNEKSESIKNRLIDKYCYARIIKT